MRQSRLAVRRLFCSQPPADNTTLGQRTMVKLKQHAEKVWWLYGLGYVVMIYPDIKKHLLDSNAKTNKEIKENFQNITGPLRVIETFLVNIILNILSSPEVVNKGVDFTTEIINDPKINAQLLKFLLDGLQHPLFLEEMKKVGIPLSLDILTDPEVQQDLIKLMLVNMILT